MGLSPLHNELTLLFSERSPARLSACLNHQSYHNFLLAHALPLPTKAIVEAFTHTSFSHEYEVPHQELAEFYGDAVVQLIVTQELLRRYPGEKEGTLSKLRSSIVNQNTLAIIARYLELENLILVGKGEFKKGLQSQAVVLSDSLEALMAKIYHHLGLEIAQERFLFWMNEAVPQAFELEGLESFDAKSRLQEAVLGKYKTLPVYEAEAKSDGFLVSLWINNQLISQGQFHSKKIGERELAKQVLAEKRY